MHLPDRRWTCSGFETVDPANGGVVAPIKADSVARKEPSHERGKSNEPGPQKEMGVIRDEHPCVTGGFRFRKEIQKALQEILPVPVVHENLSTLDTPDHNVVQDTGRV